MKRHHLLLLLGLGLLAACGSAGSGSDPIPFPIESIRAVELVRIRPEDYPTSPSHDTLAPDRIAEFIEGLRKAEDRGVGKVATYYRIRLRVGDSTVELRATETVFMPAGTDRLYAFDGGRYFLRRYFPEMFADTVGGIQDISDPSEGNLRSFPGSPGDVYWVRARPLHPANMIRCGTSAT
jgi:hypothetical protein